MRCAGAVGGPGRAEFSPATMAGRAGSGAVRPGAGAGVSTERTRAAGSGAGRAWLQALSMAGPWLRCLAGRCRASGSSRAGAHGPGGLGSSQPSQVPARPARRGARRCSGARRWGGTEGRWSSARLQPRGVQASQTPHSNGSCGGGASARSRVRLRSLAGRRRLRHHRPTHVPHAVSGTSRASVPTCPLDPHQPNVGHQQRTRRRAHPGPFFAGTASRALAPARRAANQTCLRSGEAAWRSEERPHAKSTRSRKGGTTKTR